VAGKLLTAVLISEDAAGNDWSRSNIMLASEELLKVDEDISTNAATALISAGL
jgi:hypothetical protein